MVGKGSLGEAIELEFEKKCLEIKPDTPNLRCDLVLLPEDGDSNLVASFNRKASHIDGVLGLSELQEKQVRHHPKFLRSTLFAHSPYAFIANTKLFPKNLWPKNWNEVPQKLEGKVFIQDPRISSAGIGLLKAIHLLKLISSADLKKITKKSFPSWSLSYNSFLKDEAPVVWSYQSSEAYHLCNLEGSDKGDSAFKAIPLEEGYPTQEEWLALSKNLNEIEAKLLEEAVLSDFVQKQIPLKNWMYPTSPSTSLPECYKGLTPLKSLKVSVDQFDSRILQNWLDQWSL